MVAPGRGRGRPPARPRRRAALGAGPALAISRWGSTGSIASAPTPSGSSRSACPARLGRPGAVGGRGHDRRPESPQIEATVQYRVANPVDYVLRSERRRRPADPGRRGEPLARPGPARRRRGAPVGSPADRRGGPGRPAVRGRPASPRASRILGVSLTDARPPVEVAADFAAAQSAESLRDRRINDATTDEAVKLTDASARAQAIREAARAEAERTVLIDRADARRFLALMAEARRLARPDDPPPLHRIAPVAARPRQAEAHHAGRRCDGPDRPRASGRVRRPYAPVARCAPVSRRDPASAAREFETVCNAATFRWPPFSRPIRLSIMESMERPSFQMTVGAMLGVVACIAPQYLAVPLRRTLGHPGAECDQTRRRRLPLPDPRRGSASTRRGTGRDPEANPPDARLLTPPPRQ